MRTFFGPLIPRMEYGLCPFIGHIPYSFLLFISLLTASTGMIAQPAGNSLNCFGNVNMSLNNSGYNFLEPVMFAAQSNTDNLVVRVNNTNSNFVDCSYRGQKIKITVLDTLRNLSCWSELFVEDKSTFKLLCRDTIIDCADELDNVLAEDVLEVMDNCTELSDLVILKSDSIGNYPNPLSDTLKIVYRKWTGRDYNNDLSTCVSKIYIRRLSLDSIIFPPDTVIYCGDDHTDIALTGDLMPSSQSLGGLCMLGVQEIYLDTLQFGCGLKTKYLKKWIVVDWDLMQMKMDTQIIVRQDTSEIKIIAPDSISVLMDSGCKPFAVMPAATVLSVCANIAQSEIEIFLGDTIVNIGDTICFDTFGIYNAIYRFKSSSCVTKYVGDTIRIQVMDTKKPVLDCNSIGIPILGLDSSISRLIYVDSLLKNLDFEACSPISYYARKRNPLCPGDSLSFQKIIRFCEAEICDTVEIELFAKNISGVSSDTCIFRIFVQDKIIPVLECRDSTIRFEISDTIMLDTAVLLSLWGDNKGLMSLTMTGSGLTMAGSGTAISTGSGISFFGPSGFIKFECADTGTYIVDIVATDSTGNISSCQSILTIESGAACPVSLRPGIQFLAYGITPLSGVTLEDTERKGLEWTSDPTGFIDLEEISDQKSWKMKATLADEWPKGVDVYDLYKLQAHILGISPMSASLDLLSADVNQSGSVDIFDIIDTRKIILGLDPEITHNSQPWLFFLTDGTDKSNLLDGQFDLKSIQPLGNNYRAYGIKKGDIDGSSVAGAGTRSGRSKARVSYVRKSSTTGEVVINIGEYDAMQMRLRLPEYASYISMNSTDIHVNYSGNELTLLDYNPVKGDESGGEKRIRISIQHNPAIRLDASMFELDEVYSKEYNQFGVSRKLEFDYDKTFVSGEYDIHLVPNPSEGKAQLFLSGILEGSSAQYIEYGIYNSSGQKVSGKQWNGSLNADSIFPLELPETLDQGAYFIRVQIDSKIYTDIFLKL